MCRRWSEHVDCDSEVQEWVDLANSRNSYHQNDFFPQQPSTDSRIVSVATHLLNNYRQNDVLQQSPNDSRMADGARGAARWVWWCRLAEVALRAMCPRWSERVGESNVAELASGFHVDQYLPVLHFPG
eukprot:797386_1